MADRQAGTMPEVSHVFTAMASQVTVRVLEPSRDALDAVAAVEDAFRRIERACTRFDDTSDLMRANATGRDWVEVDHECFSALQLAHEAHHATDGVFDPRVMQSLLNLGYSTSLNFASGPVETTGDVALVQVPLDRWGLELNEATSSVRIGDRPVDLGGIGKGYAVRRAIAQLWRDGDPVGGSALVEAGGDLATFGPGPWRPEQPGWRAAVEDPRGGTDPVAVLDVSNQAAATSSIRTRRWTASGVSVHHLIDPASGRPADSGVLAVTVVADDPAWAEVWSKVGFLYGADRIRDFFEDRQIAALWVDEVGAVQVTAPMASRVLWRYDDAS